MDSDDRDTRTAWHWFLVEVEEGAAFSTAAFTLRRHRRQALAVSPFSGWGGFRVPGGYFRSLVP